MSDQIYCQHVREDGDRCRAWAKKGRGFCYYHDPATAQERETGLRAPSEARPAQSAGPPVLPEPVRLETIEDLHAALRATFNHVAVAETADTSRAQTLATLGGVMLRAVNIRDLQRRVEELAADLAQSRSLIEDLERQRDFARDDLERCRANVRELRRQERVYREALARAGVDPDGAGLS
jgi:hypothetical protein